jgi:hypothetical protein
MEGLVSLLGEGDGDNFDLVYFTIPLTLEMKFILKLI